MWFKGQYPVAILAIVVGLALFGSFQFTGEIGNLTANLSFIIDSATVSLLGVGIALLVGPKLYGGSKMPRDSAVSKSGSKKGTKKEKAEKEKIACDNCQTVFTPQWKERELKSGKIVDVAVCPQCGEDNEFEIIEDDEEE
jgi:hypothetical protein